MTNKQVAYQNITLIITLLSLVLNYVLIPKYGIVGAAISTLVTTAIWNITCIVFIKAKLNIITFINPVFIIKYLKLK
jgi:O-antigen/teichoic acid export membrane protein